MEVKIPRSRLCLSLLLTVPTASIAAEIDLPPVNVAAEARTSFTSTDFDASDEDINDFTLNSVRLYVNGGVTENIKYSFSAEYDGEDVVVLDAIAQFEFSEKFNIWAGRFLPPSDRANLYGPYYANHWGSFRDGVQDGYPFVGNAGRQDGVAYWGQFGKLKVQAGAFDVPVTQGDSDVVYAGRVMVDLWDPEPGYYLNGTYYGDKDVLAFGVAAQQAGSNKAYSFDALMEKKLANSGVLSLEGEYAKYDGLGGYAGDESDGYYVLAAYLFPQPVGIGRFQLLGKYGEATFETLGLPDVDQETTEINLNYIIRGFKARVSLFYIDTSFDPSTGADSKQYGIGLQLQL